MQIERATGLAIALFGLLAGCTTVSPTQRGTLAKPEMQFDADIGHAIISRYTYPSKEAAAGGAAAGGGGCGCK